VSRLPYLNREDISPEYQDIIARGLNLHRVLLHSPGAARASGQAGAYIRHHSSLDPRLRELAILQIAYLAGAEYEYSHHLKIARDFGLSDQDLGAVARAASGDLSDLNPLTRTVLQAAREMQTEPAIRLETFRELEAGLTREALVDLVFTLAFYVGFVKLTGSFELDVEPEYMPYLSSFPLRPDGVN
jgi:alkylhydroperoxidase family enzyme